MDRSPAVQSPALPGFFKFSSEKEAAEESGGKSAQAPTQWMRPHVFRRALFDPRGAGSIDDFFQLFVDALPCPQRFPLKFLHGPGEASFF